MRPLNGARGRASGRSRTWLSIDSSSPTRSKLTAAIDSVSLIFERSFIGLYILSRYSTKTSSAPGGQPVVEHEPDAEPEHEARADRDDDVDLRRESRLEAARAQTQVDARLASVIEPLLLESSRRRTP